MTPAQGAQAKVEMQSGQVAVGAANGVVSVSNMDGVLLARVNPGIPLSFEPTSEPLSKLTGRLEKRGDQYFLTDELTHVQVELLGKDLASRVGQRIGVMGTPKPGTGHQILEVAKTTHLTEAPEFSTAAKATTGLSHGTKIGLAVVGGSVAAAGVSIGAISR